jgi:Carboxypeptidase regulatory-like domain
MLLLTAIAQPARAATTGAVSGVVCNARGTPQIGALVQLVNTDLTVITETFTDDHGRYTLKNVVPGLYGVKASASLFLPTLRENLRIAANSKAVVNLTLDTLYEAFRWLPAQPRQVNEPRDDWEWTLRLSANKPLLRMLQDGPLVVVTDGTGQSPELKARVTIRGGESRFGDGGIHHDFELERVKDDTRQLILRADLGQSDEPSINTVVAYERQLGLGRTMRTVAAFVDQPQIVGGPNMQGLQAMVFRTAETMDLTPAIGAEAGGETEIVHMGTTHLASHPFASVHMRAGDGLVTYRVSTAPGVQEAAMLDQANTLTPAIAERDGQLVMEHGLHQELSYAQSAGTFRMQMTVFHDRVDNPLVSGGGEISTADWNSGNVLYDPSTDSIEVAGEGFTGTGFVAELGDIMPDKMWMAFTAGMGDALQMNGFAQQGTIQQGLASMQARQTASYSAAVGGSMQRAGTVWRASYRWQQPGSVTAVDPFNKNMPAPYLSFFVRQPLHCKRVLPNGMEALVDVRNLLAEGYRPFISSDGSVLYFAQTARAIEGGLSFTF